MRRVKPLPKRRRTVAHDGEDNQMLAVLKSAQAGGAYGSDSLITNSSALAAQLALQSYYLPILGSAQSLQPNDADDDADRRDKIDFGYNLGGRTQDEEHSGDGDYIDHLQQPGNTKKRKVPANAGTSPHGGHDAVVGLMGEDDSGSAIERGSATGGDRGGGDTLLASGGSSVTTGSMTLRAKWTLSRPTMIGLQHKEMLRQRKRQLAAVLGAISHGDTLALDQALGSIYAVPSVTANVQQPRVRLSRRRLPRIARRTKSLVQVNLNIGAPLPAAFTFMCHSPSEYAVSLYIIIVMTIRARAFSFGAARHCQTGSSSPA